MFEGNYDNIILNKNTAILIEIKDLQDPINRHIVCYLLCNDAGLPKLERKVDLNRGVVL